MKKKVCPNCGRSFIRHKKYTKGDEIFIHKEEVLKIPFPHVSVTDSCFISNKEKERTK